MFLTFLGQCRDTKLLNSLVVMIRNCVKYINNFNTSLLPFIVLSDMKGKSLFTLVELVEVIEQTSVVFLLE